MTRAGLVGVSGYAGMELARLLSRHPSIKLTKAYSRVEAGKTLGDLYPFLRNLPGSETKISLFDTKECARDCDLIFLAVPAGEARKMVPELLAENLQVIDFSADYRLRDPGIYRQWYKLPCENDNALRDAVYGLPELYAAKIAKARLVANPGCYPTASILGARAALKNGIIDTDSIVIDAKSGASGAGRKPSLETLFCEVSANFRPYGVPGHRHTPEIEQEFSLIAGKEIRLSFVPHLVPMKRGILCSIYAPLTHPYTIEDIYEKFVETWKYYPWIRIKRPGELPDTANTRGSMYCDIGFAIDDRTNRLIIFSAIDNLCRGAAGQALACANLMRGLPVETGMVDLCPMP